MMTADLVEYLTKLDEMVTKRHPDLLYEGKIEMDTDELDYVIIKLKGVRVA